MLSYRFDSSGKFQVRREALSKHKEIDETNAAYCCAVCQHVITSGSSAISVEGEHTHIKSNPNGRKFLLRCFSSAVGCAMSGDSTSYFSWFAGYKWQFAHCKECGAQIGWFFEGQGNFFGLIKEQLVRCDN